MIKDVFLITVDVVYDFQVLSRWYQHFKLGWPFLFIFVSFDKLFGIFILAWNRLSWLIVFVVLNVSLDFYCILRLYYILFWAFRTMHFLKLRVGDVSCNARTPASLTGTGKWTPQQTNNIIMRQENRIYTYSEIWNVNLNKTNTTTDK